MSGLRVLRVAEGLWRWSVPDAGGDEGERASAYLETPAATVLVDPAVPADPDEVERFWRALDRDVARNRAPVVVVLTSERHRRDEPAVRARYGAALAEADAPPPAGVRAIPVGPGERALLVASHRALLVGDAVRAVGGGLAVVDPGAAAALAPVADGVEIVLPAHGPPLLAGGGAALAAATRPDPPSG